MSLRVTAEQDAGLQPDGLAATGCWEVWTERLQVFRTEIERSPQRGIACWAASVTAPGRCTSS